jgi:K+-sensing histidine kinase KdpD
MGTAGVYRVAEESCLTIRPRHSGAGWNPVRQPFARLNESRGKQPGSGLGLAIVERISGLHDGYLDLQVRDGGGLIASIVLPLNETETVA